jgi:hypothetical protein
MELILAVLGAGPIGYFTKTLKRGVVTYLVLWAIVFPIQSIDVAADGHIDVLYFVVNALILFLGIGLNRLGSVLGDRRRAKVEAFTEANAARPAA